MSSCVCLTGEPCPVAQKEGLFGSNPKNFRAIHTVRVEVAAIPLVSIFHRRFGACGRYNRRIKKIKRGLAATFKASHIVQIDMYQSGYQLDEWLSATVVVFKEA